MMFPLEPLHRPTGTSIPSGAVSDGAANFVPSASPALAQMKPVERNSPLVREFPNKPVFISNPKLSPSTITTEQALQARSTLAPQFQHNAMATKLARTSNLHSDLPRFSNQLNILA